MQKCIPNYSCIDTYIFHVSNILSGCANWQPDVLRKPESLDDKKEALNGLDRDSALTEELYTLLNETYGMQRLFLNKAEPPSIEIILKEWPVLFHPEVVFWHFQKLVLRNLNDLETMFTVKKRKLVQFGIQHKLLDHIPDENEEKELTFVLNIVAKYFKEDISHLIHNWEEVSYILT